MRDLPGFPWERAQPVRSFSWRSGQRHRSGLAFMEATGRGHGFESLAERRTLTVLDFCGQVRDVLSQPFRLRFLDSGRRREHVPDFLVASKDSTLLIDVRPAPLVKESDIAVFAATGRVAASAGWRYLVVTGWRDGVESSVDALARARRPGTDPLRLEEQLLAAAVGPRRFRELVEATSWPVPARSRIRLRHHAQHCSLAMTAVIRRSVRLPRNAAGPPAHFPQPATHLGRLDPRAIPAVLPEHWAVPLDELDAP
ncbi:TnsA-like heteromeric transposase endonuclease subunit [Streptomyces sp. NPDC055059]